MFYFLNIIYTILNNESNNLFAFLNIIFYNVDKQLERNMNMGFSFKPLWRLLVDKDMSKTEYREALGISSATLAKMGKGEYVSMEVLDKTCNHFKVSLHEVVEHVEEPSQE
jgi:putative transcriptional regulator